ncbi:MAG: NADH-quinone oxidoreductase subunit L [Myxococcota bacterium]
MVDGHADPLLRWIVLLPLLAAVVHGISLAWLRRPLSRNATIAISCGAPALAFLLAFVSLFRLVGMPADARFLTDVLYTWIGSGILSADAAFLFDPLSAVMTLVVTGVGSLIHFYSVGYMDDDHREDRGFQRFFCYLNLFLFSMLVLVLGDNLVLMFLGWEGVGLCSYLLIGFWYSDRWNAYCGSKAFIVNRIGDFGFLLGVFLLFWALAEVDAATVSFRELATALPQIADRTVTLPAWLGWLPGAPTWKLTTLIGLCFFLGAAGKSAQIPLYIWLPDAMAGPTPVSALIHAATMVTAGVYMVCRMSFLYAEAPGASAVIAWVGAATAVLAAVIAIAQTDIKKVLAYSTVSQLGYMFLAAGCGAYSAAIFHVVTHAFFKALLFLGSGAVILAMHHEQDTDKMGGLRQQIPWTHRWFAIGVLAIAGFPFMSGFYSKDEILLSAYLAHDLPGYSALYAIALVTAGVTAFYMVRLHIRTFWGESRVPVEQRSHVHEPNQWVLAPLAVLGVLSVFGGFLGPSAALNPVPGVDPEHSNSLANFLAPVLHGVHHEVSFATERWLAVGSVAVAGVGIGVAFWLYLWQPALPGKIRQALAGAHRLVVNKFYVDELYDALFVRPTVSASENVLYRGIDATVIDDVAVNGSARFVRGFASGVLRHFQSGLAQGYLVVMLIGTILIAGFLVAS